MKKVKKLFLIALTVFILLSFATFLMRFTEDSAQQHFDFDKESLLLITEYLKNEPEQYIHSLGWTVNIIEPATTQHLFSIENATAKNTIAYLFCIRGYYCIEKTDDSIIFIKEIWKRDSGIVYLMDNNPSKLEDEVNYLTKSKPLKDPGWYYFESDYDVWYTQNYS